MRILVKVKVINNNMFYEVLEPKKFEPKTEYSIVNSKVGVCVEAYSEKSKTALHSFIEKNRGVGFTIYDKDGSIAGVLDSEFLKDSSILYNQIN